MANKDHIRRLSALFNGLARAHGKYYLGEPDPETGKMQGTALTVREPWTDEDWEAHLDGKVGLGIVPFDEDGTTCFGTIDIDDYNVDKKAIGDKLAGLGVRHVITDSKSDGAHVHVLLSSREPAKALREVLNQIRVLIGYPNAEVFPKQDKPASENDVGNWINMPYFGDTRKMFGGHGLDFFLDYAEGIKTSVAELRSLDLQSRIEEDPAHTYPPCILRMMSEGIGSGSRNTALFNMGVLMNKVHGEEAAEPIMECNKQYMTPPLPNKEVAGIIASTGRREYGYQCDHEPLTGYCNKVVCKTRKYGVGRGEGDNGLALQIDGLVKYNTDPVIWYLQFEGTRVELSTAELYRFSMVQQRVAEVLTKHLGVMKNNDWLELVQRLMEDVEIVEFSDDAGDFGAFKQHLHEFLTNNASVNRDDILNGVPWKDEDGNYHFRLPDVMDHLRNKRFTRYTQAHVAARLHQLKATSHEGSIKNASVRWWKIEPFYKAQEQEFDKPKVEGVPYQDEDVDTGSTGDGEDNNPSQHSG